MGESLWALLGGTVGSMLTYLGVRYASRLSRQSAHETTTLTAGVEHYAADTERLQALWDRVDRMQEQIETLRALERERDLRDARRDRMIREHQSWDDVAVAELHRVSVAISDPPPLTVGG